MGLYSLRLTINSLLYIKMEIKALCFYAVLEQSWHIPNTCGKDCYWACPRGTESAKMSTVLVAWGMHVSNILPGKINCYRLNNCWFKQFWSLDISCSFRFQMELAHLLRTTGRPAAGSESLVILHIVIIVFWPRTGSVVFRKPPRENFTK